MGKKLGIKFTDFWPGFAPENNYFLSLISSLYEVEFSEVPDLLIYSCYGNEHLRYDCLRVFYTAENFRPDFYGCDFAIGFDYNTDPRYYRLPLYALYIDQENSISTLLKERSREQAVEIWRSKTKFCCMVVSNGEAKKRLQFFEKLSKYKKVDSGGKVLNNIGGPVKDKMSFIRDYRFVIAFENASYPGYTTEKIIEPLIAGCVPLYWGDPMVTKDFNAGCFLNLHNGKSDEQLIEEIIAIDTNEEKAFKMLEEPIFADAKMPDDISKEKLIAFFEKIIVDSKNILPVAKTWKKYIHVYNIKKTYYRNRVKGIINKIRIK